MKVHYSKILLFSLPLNILVSSYEHNKYKTYTKPHHTTTTTSRVLSECDINTSIYDDPDMKSVKENFDRQTSERFEEYDERMKDKRRKYKEQCDKDIQEIIVKDKINKSLAEKVEKGCLRCGCGLGGVAAGVGIIGPIVVNELKKAALLAADLKGIDAGIKAAIEGVKGIWELGHVSGVNVENIVTPMNFSSQNLLGQAVQTLGNEICDEGGVAHEKLFCLLADGKNAAKFAKGIADHSRCVAIKAGEEAAKITSEEITAANMTSSNMYLAIGYSVLAILIILLVMVIIYLILRYRRKKKINKKHQYTKLLNQ
ncbi:rifin [Plasmodium sp. gorilla clade G1]|nr:rifin [Plasmodium sp. gorilla clade G1]